MSCRRCVVRAECLEWALSHPKVFGVWGDTTPRDRRGLGPRLVHNTTRTAVKRRQSPIPEKASHLRKHAKAQAARFPAHPRRGEVRGSIPLWSTPYKPWSAALAQELGHHCDRCSSFRPAPSPSSSQTSKARRGYWTHSDRSATRRH
ncbi:MAG TPA: WhiB family transcriptional regulator [Actinomycetota bacterium]|nr:WhiB family transcriptional regulator [Actinomycetota bacterium]